MWRRALQDFLQDIIAKNLLYSMDSRCRYAGEMIKHGFIGPASAACLPLQALSQTFVAALHVSVLGIGRYIGQAAQKHTRMQQS